MSLMMNGAAGDYSGPVERFIPADLAGLRVDQALARMFPEHSRSRLAAWLRDGRITVDATRVAAKRKVWGGERVTVRVERSPDAEAYRAEALPLAIVHEDEALIVVDKPAA